MPLYRIRSEWGLHTRFRCSRQAMILCHIRFQYLTQYFHRAMTKSGYCGSGFTKQFGYFLHRLPFPIAKDYHLPLFDWQTLYGVRNGANFILANKDLARTGGLVFEEMLELHTRRYVPFLYGPRMFSTTVRILDRIVRSFRIPCLQQRTCHSEARRHPRLELRIRIRLEASFLGLEAKTSWACRFSHRRCCSHCCISMICSVDPLRFCTIFRGYVEYDF